MITTALCALFPVLLIIAAWRELVTRAVPLWISLVLVAVYLAAAFTAGFPIEVMALYTVPALVVLTVGGLLVHFKFIQIGEACLLTAVVTWIGLAAIMPFAFCVAVVWIIPSLICALLSVRNRFPAAAAIGLSALVAAPHSPLLAAGLAGLSI